MFKVIFIVICQQGSNTKTKKINANIHTTALAVYKFVYFAEEEKNFRFISAEC